MRTIIFDDDGIIDLGNLDVGDLHNTLAEVLGEPKVVIPIDPDDPPTFGDTGA